jgi:hypothetical protein
MPARSRVISTFGKTAAETDANISSPGFLVLAVKAACPITIGRPASSVKNRVQNERAGSLLG